MESDTYARRRRRLRELIDANYGGRQVDFAQAIDREPNYVSRCLNGVKRIGEDLARHICAKCGLPDGWLDAEPGAMFTSSEHQQLLRRLRKLPPEKLKIVDDVIRAMLPSLEQDESIADTLLKKAPLSKERAAELLPPAPETFEP